MARKLWGTGSVELGSFEVKEPEWGRILHVDFKENKQGLMCKITERCKGERKTIVFSPKRGPELALAILRHSPDDAPGVREAILALTPKEPKKGGD